MKKLLLFIITILIFIPTFVFAEDNNIVIESITMVEKSSTASEVTPAKAKNTSIDLDISFAKVNDYIKYKLVIKNDTDDDYVLDESLFVKKYSNISYTFETESKTVSAHSSRELILNVKYEVAKDFGVYNETNTFDIGLTGGPLENPPTGVRSLLIAIPVIVLLGFIFVKNINNKKAFKVMIIIVGILSIPTIVYALNKCTISINSKIFIENCRYKLTTEGGTFEEDKDVNEVCIIDELFTGYDYEHVQWGRYYPVKTNIYSHPVIFVRTKSWDSVYNLFGDTSYIKVYSDSSKNNLIRTITKIDLPKHYYSIMNGDYIDEYIAFGFDGYNSVYLDISSDISSSLYIIDGFTDELNTLNYKNELLTTNEELLGKINTLARTGPKSLYGFDNCENEICEGNIYKAKWDDIYVM